MNKIYMMDIIEYTKLKESGIFWELYPEAKGDYHEDQKLSIQGKFKIEQTDV